MTLDQIERMVRQANPVPDLSALEPIDASVLDEQRRMDMQTHDRVIVDDEGGEPKRDRNLLIGIAAAAAIIIGALLLLRPLTNDAPVANDQPATAVQIATEFLTAIASRDADRAISYLSAEALSELGGMESLRSEFRWREATGFELLPGTCEEANSTPTEIFVECPYDYHGIRSAEQGLGPYTGSRYLFTIRDGVIALVRDLIVFSENGFSDQMWEPFAHWIGENQNGDGPVMYADWPSMGLQSHSEESIALWDQRSREYVDVVLERRADAVDVATSFIEAFFSFDVDLAASYLAPDADLRTFELDGATWQMNNRLMEAWGWKVYLDSCEATGAEVIAVSCPFATQTLHSDEMGLGPFGDNTFAVGVEDGQIVSAAWQLAYLTNGFDTQVWRPFTRWIAQNYAEDGPVMFTDWPRANQEAVTEESIGLWEQRSREYAEAIRAGQ